MSALALVLALGQVPMHASQPVHPILPGAQIAGIRALQPARAARAQAEILALRSQFGLDPRSAFPIHLAFTNAQGETIVRMDQTFDGHRVWGGQVLARVLPEGTVQTVTRCIQPSALVEGGPRLNAAQAIRIALKHLDAKGAMKDAPRAEQVLFPARFLGGIATILDAEGHRVIDRKNLVYAQLSTPYVWAYEVKTRLDNPADGLKEMTYIIDGSTGNVLRISDAIEHQAAPAPSSGTGTGLYSGQITLNSTQMLDGTFALVDSTRGTLPNPYLSTFTPDGSGWSPLGLQAWYDEHDADGNSTWNTFLFQSNPSNTWGDGKAFTAWGQENGTNGQTAGVDALHAMGVTWDFFRNVFLRDGMDGQGTSAFAEVLMTNSWYVDNAMWSPWSGGMFIGAGSATLPPTNGSYNPTGLQSLAALDVIAHEMTHGVTASTANFVNAPGYEESGLNEATSDFFAQMVKAYTSRSASFPLNMIPPTGSDWVIGTGPGGGTPLRWMNHPSLDHRSADAWYDGIKYLDGHYSMGAISRALYFLANGSSSLPGNDAYSVYLPEGMTGIGNDAAARIWYKTVTEQLLSDGTGSITMLDARDAALASAEDLYGQDSIQALAVESAFSAANIGEAPGHAPRTKVLFADWRNGDYIDTTHYGGFWASRQAFPKGETVVPRITVLNNNNTAVSWSTGGPSMYNGSDSLVEAGGKINADGSWTTPNRMGWFAITATSKADPNQFAEGRCFLINMDTDADSEQDALDMGGIAFSWYLTRGLSLNHSVFQAPWVDDGDVAMFVDAMKSTWPVK
jgi:Zn-dependent metalloprotease